MSEDVYWDRLDRTVPLNGDSGNAGVPGPHGASSSAPEGLPERYSIQRLLGRGGIAEVFLAHDQILDRFVALKWIPRSIGPALVPVPEFQAEARLMGRLSHPNIVTIYDWGITPSGDYLVLEYCPGTDLGKLVRTEGTLSESQVVAIMGDIIRAVNYAHLKGVVHGDIKPANLLLGFDGIVKVTDYGAGRRIARGDKDVWATPFFAAPEVLSGGKPTPASDTFSLAMTAVHLLTGSDLPRPDGLKVLSGHLRNHGVSDKLAQWILLGVTEQPNDRPGLEQWYHLLPKVSVHDDSPRAKRMPSSEAVPLGRKGHEVAERNWAAEPAWIRLGAQLLSFAHDVLHWRRGRLVLACEASLVAYFMHNLSMAGNYLFPAFDPMIRQVGIPVAAFIAVLLSLRLGVTLLLWSLALPLFMEVAGWGIIYTLFALVATPVLGIAPATSLHVLAYPLLGFNSLGYAGAGLTGHYLGPWKGALVGGGGRILFYFLVGVSNSPFMGRLLQYGLISTEGIGIIDSIIDGIIPALQFSLAWPRSGYVLMSALVGVLCGAWIPERPYDYLLQFLGFASLVGLAHLALALPVPWDEFGISLTVLGAVSVAEFFGSKLRRSQPSHLE